MAKKKSKNNKKQIKKVTKPTEKIENEEIQEDTEVIEEEVNKDDTSKKDIKKNKESKKDKKSAKLEKKANKSHWFKDFKAELKKIIWPNRKELTNNTIVVIVVVIIVSVLVFVLDLIFKELTTLGVKQIEKLQGDSNIVNEMVIDNEVSENVVADDEEGTELNQTNTSTEE